MFSSSKLSLSFHLPHQSYVCRSLIYQRAICPTKLVVVDVMITLILHGQGHIYIFIYLFIYLFRL